MSMEYSRFIEVDGLTTHVLELGSGPPVVLLHSGEFGACAEASWHDLMPELAEAGYHVVAPDWLGFGKTDKVVDFADPNGRRMRHMAATLAACEIGSAAYVGSSMGATFLVRTLADELPLFDVAVAVLVSGGGFAPDNQARQQILDYDLTERGMSKILRAMMYSARLADDEQYVSWRHQLSLEPGAWQCAASARLRPPSETPALSGDFGKADTTPYENVRVPTLIVAGANDPLRLPGYAYELGQRIPDSQVENYSECGHLPNIEHPKQFQEDLIHFLQQRYQAGSPA